LAHRFPIKVKAVAALSVPLLLLLGVTASQVRASAANVRDVREQADLATAAIGPSGAINALMNERNYTTLWMYGVDTAVALPVGDMEGARAATDESIQAFRAEVERKGARRHASTPGRCRRSTACPSCARPSTSTRASATS
jgi:hypothetical protein